MPEWLAVLFAFAAGIAALGVCTGFAWWLVKPRVIAWLEVRLIQPVQDTRHQVTENHHSSERPTVLDKLDDLGKRFDRHVDWSDEEVRRLWTAIGRQQP